MIGQERLKEGAEKTLGFEKEGRLLSETCNGETIAFLNRSIGSNGFPSIATYYNYYLVQSKTLDQ